MMLVYRVATFNQAHLIGSKLMLKQLRLLLLQGLDLVLKSNLLRHDAINLTARTTMRVLSCLGIVTVILLLLLLLRLLILLRELESGILFANGRSNGSNGHAIIATLGT